MAAFEAVAAANPGVTFVLVGHAFEATTYETLSHVTSIVFAAAEPEQSAVAGAVGNAIRNFRRTVLKPGVITVE